MLAPNKACILLLYYFNMDEVVYTLVEKPFFSFKEKKAWNFHSMLAPNKACILLLYYSKIEEVVYTLVEKPFVYSNNIKTK